MGFLASLSQWLKGNGTGAQGPSDPESGDPPDTKVHRRHISLGESTDIAVGVGCLLSVTDRNFMVEIVEVTGDAIRVTFPGVDYPVEGMLVELEFHDKSGFSYYQTKVRQGPLKEGDGIVLDKPANINRQQHRDSCRVPTNLEAKVKDQVHMKKYDGKIVNMSTGGVMLESTASFEMGTTLEISLKLPDSPEIHNLMAQILHVGEPRQSDAGPVHIYGTRFVGYEPGTGRVVTNFIWSRLRELYPSV